MTREFSITTDKNEKLRHPPLVIKIFEHSLVIGELDIGYCIIGC